MNRNFLDAYKTPNSILNGPRGAIPLGLHGLQCSQKVLWINADHTAARAIKISYQEKSNGNDERQDEEQQSTFATLAVADQQVT